MGPGCNRMLDGNEAGFVAQLQCLMHWVDKVRVGQDTTSAKDSCRFAASDVVSGPEVVLPVN